MVDFSHPVSLACHRKTTARHYSFLLVMLTLTSFVLPACSQISNIAFRQKDEPKAGSIVFTDDFSSSESGWGTWNRDGSYITYRDGGLRFMINESQFDFWSVAGKNYTDAQIEVDAIKLNGPDDNDFGVVCRYQNKDNFYMLIISSDGYYGAAKMKGGQYTMIGPNQLQYSESIRKGLAINRLRADCKGSTLRLSVNGQKLIEVNDTDFPAGDVGLIAGAYNNKGVDVLFDNFVVKKP